MRNGHRYQTKCTAHRGWCSLLLNPLLRSDRTGRPLHILALDLSSCASERCWYGARECLGIQNGRWLIWQVFYKYCKAIKIGPSRESLDEKVQGVVFCPISLVLCCRSILFFEPPVLLVQSQGRGGDRMDGVSRGSRALEGQRGGDVTAVERENTATGRLPCGAGHIGRRDAAVPHVGWHLGGRVVRMDAGSCDIAVHCGQSIRRLKTESSQRKTSGRRPHTAIEMSIKISRQRW